MAGNQIKNPVEIIKLKHLPHLKSLVLEGNPLSNNKDFSDYAFEVKELLPQLKKLDGIVI
jgi:hypothetical protein